MRTSLTLASLALASLVLLHATDDAVAFAAEPRLRATGGSTVMVRLAEARLPAIALSAEPGRAYRLRLPGVENALATLTDLTDGAPRSETDLFVRHGELLLSPTELIAGHAYRVRVSGASGAVIVWLRPPRAPSGPSRVRFDARELASPASDELAPVPKRL